MAAHSVTVDELAKHNHETDHTSAATDTTLNTWPMLDRKAPSKWQLTGIRPAGGDKPHNNLAGRAIYGPGRPKRCETTHKSLLTAECCYEAYRHPRTSRYY